MKSRNPIAIVLTTVSLVLFAIACDKSNPDNGNKTIYNDKSEAIVTGGVYDVDYTSAGIYGYLNLPSEMLGIVKFGIIYSSSKNPSSSNGTVKYVTELDRDGRFDISIKDLDPNSTYYYCAFVMHINGTYQYGKVLSFYTKSLQTSISANVTDVSFYTATISCNVTVETAGVSVQWVDVLYCTDEEKRWTRRSLSSDRNGKYFVNLESLQDDTRYYYYVVVDFDNDVSITTDIEEFSTESIPEIVDLGLSVKWRSNNLYYLEDEYIYVQWAGTSSVNDFNLNFMYLACPYHSGKDFKINWTKYVPSDKSSYWSGTGRPDNKTELELSDDKAHDNLGGNWRIPTKDEWIELINNCTWKWTTLNGVKGYTVTSKKVGYTNKFIFLPAGGEHFDGRLAVNDWGEYWSSTLDVDDPSCAYMLFFDSNNIKIESYGRSNGYTIRPVSN